MVLLLIFGFLAGAATAISPCALPVLPVVFSAGATGGHRRPLGIALGLALSFTFATVLLVYLISALGLPDSLLRTLAIAVLLGFGISLIVPGASDRIEGWISRATSRSAGRVSAATQNEGSGFWSGMLVGAGLGFVYAPCAGPILAGVITVSASQDFSTQRLAVALAYGLGSAAMFLALMLGGRKLIRPLMERSRALQAGLGVLMVMVAVGMLVNLDTRFQTAIADHLPAALVNPTGKLEKTSAAQDELDDLRSSGQQTSARRQALEGSFSLEPIMEAPDFTDTEQWFNTPEGKPLTLRQLHGKVVLVDFWTYSCINCIRTLPYLKSWYAKYRDKGFVIVGVHSPEFAFEKSAKNVAAAIGQNGIKYPVAQDNEFGTWDAYANQYWPAHYLIDAAGVVRQIHYGEGKYAESEQAIRTLLRENGATGLGGETSDGVRAEHASNAQVTPETYVGFERATGFEGRPPSASTTNYGSPTGRLPLNTFRLGGRWLVSGERATAGSGATLTARVHARRTFLVLGSAGGAPRRMQVLLDGKPISSGDSGDDVHGGYVTVSSQRLYRLIDTGKVETHTLTLRPAPRISAYAFTFG
ncbi:MAG: cytochrome c biogenesis protein DipZ [Solirubrobacterales bacterium]